MTGEIAKTSNKFGDQPTLAIRQVAPADWDTHYKKAAKHQLVRQQTAGAQRVESRALELVWSSGFSYWLDSCHWQRDRVEWRFLNDSYMYYALCSSLPFSYHLLNQNDQLTSRYKFILY